MIADLDTMEELSPDTLLGETIPEEDGFDPARLDQIMKKKLGKHSNLIDWTPETDKQRTLFPFGIAACIVLILGLGTFLWLRSKRLPIEIPTTHPVEATLRWQLGSAMDSLVLGELNQDISYKAGGIQIARIKNQFFFREVQDRTSTHKDTVAYHVGVKGDENIQVFFQDSIRVQLFPKSTLSFLVFPAGTTQKRKELDFEGEALFNVNPNYAIPTLVKTRKQNILVLGTFFKLRDYKSEDTGAVFCYRGKVRVSDAGSTTIVDSAQRATVQPGRAIKVSERDFPLAKWSSPELTFDFTNASLEEAMHTIAQWYGIPKVEFEGSVDKHTKGKVFIGPISRYLTLQQLLNVLENNKLHFSIQENSILVKGNSSRLDHNR